MTFFTFKYFQISVAELNARNVMWPGLSSFFHILKISVEGILLKKIYDSCIAKLLEMKTLYTFFRHFATI